MRLNNVLIYLSPALFAGVMLGVFSTEVVLAIMFASLINLNRHELAIVLSFVFAPMMGMVFSHYHLGVPGSLLCLILATLLSLKDIGDIFHSMGQSFRYVFVLWLIVFIYYILTGSTKNSHDKFFELTEILIFSILPIYVLSFAKDVRTEIVAVVFLYSSIFFIAAAQNYMGYSSFHGLLDFDTFRYDSVQKSHAMEAHISYHRPGLQCMFAFSFFLSAAKKIDLRTAVLLVVGFWIALVAGARQAMIGEIIVIVVWLAFRSGGNQQIWNLLLAILALGVLLMSLFSLNLQVFSGITQSGDIQGDLNRDWEYPVYLISNHLFSGVGFGNYVNPFSDEVYPHNLILEILCEFGLVGFLIFSSVLLLWLVMERPRFLQRIRCGSLAVLLILPYLIRSMISEDLSHNFILFVVTIALFSTPKTNRKELYGK